MITISLCMIVRDEEPVLARCLESVRDIADEIVIVDTGSADRPKEAAAAYTDRIYDFPWVDDFAAARNFSFSKAEKEYILWLDADDVLEESDRLAFRKLKEELDPRTDMVMMRYNIAFDEEGRPVFSYERERLMRREAGFRWKGAVHEVIQPAGIIFHSPIAVTHRKERVNDPDRNLRIFEKLLAEGKTLDPRQQYYYARELAAHGRDREAAERFLDFLDCKEGWAENCIGACLDLSACLERMGEGDAALGALFRSFSYDLPRPEICCAAGAHYLGRRDYARAAFWYETALRCPPASGGFEQAEYRDFIPLIQLCVCYDSLGDRERAYAFHLQSRALRPHHPSVLANEEYFRRLRELPQNL